MNPAKGQPLSVVLDFDGTITVDDIGDKVIEKFASDGWQDAYRRLLVGELAVGEAWAIEANHLNRADERAMVDFAITQARTRPGLAAFLEFAARRGVAVEVASSGFHFYVDAIMRREGMDGTARARPTVRWDQSGRGVLAFGDGLRDCASTALCKCDRIWSHRRNGRRVVFVGDGFSDVCAATQADVLLARGKLAELAPRLGLEFRPFDDFFDVKREVQRLLSE